MINWLRGIFGARANYEDPATPLTTIGDIEDGIGTDAYITPRNAMRVPAIWCAVNFISNTIAGLPLNAYRVNPDGYQTLAANTHIHRLLNRSPAPRATSFKWLRMMVANACLRGVGVSWIERSRDGNNQIINIWKLPQQNLRITVGDDGALRYMYYNRQGLPSAIYHEDEVIDLRFFHADEGDQVVNPVVELRECIKLSMSLSRYADGYFENGGVPRGVISGDIKTAKGLEKAATEIRRAIRFANRFASGLIHLPPGHNLTMFGNTAQESQMEQARRFQVEETARIYSLPPIFLQDLSKGTYQNTEQAGRNVIIHTARGWIRQLEQELDLKLFGRTDVSRIARFDESDLTRGDNRNRIEGQARMVQTALRTPNEVRAMDNQPPMPAETLLRQKQLVPLVEDDEEDPSGDDTMPMIPPSSVYNGQGLTV